MPKRGEALYLARSPVITSNTPYPFGGKVATVETPAFRCMVSTAKESLFKRQSVQFSDFTEGMEHRRHVAKLFYSKAVPSKARLEMHDMIAHILDAAGMEGSSLNSAIEVLFARFETEGVASGVIF